MEHVALSIIICTINEDYTARALRSLFGKTVEGDEILVVVDGKQFLNSNCLQEMITQRGGRWRMIVNETNQGLSYCRNLGLREINNRYCVFLDDDVIVTDHAIEQYRKDFAAGHDMVGGLLKLPEDYPPLPVWFPDGMTSLLGVHSFQKKIWGANFGFDAEYARSHNFTFDQNLGRKGRGLESGDDTSFIKKFCDSGKTPFFDESILIYHCINPNRYKYMYLARRSFWQGVSEIRRNNFVPGLKKELRRAFQIQNNGSSFVYLMKSFVSASLIGAFLIGATKEMVIRQWKKWMY